MDLAAFDNILLEPVQEGLLIDLVEAARNIPLDQRRKFLVAQTSGGDFIIHPGLAKDKTKVYFGDIEALDRVGLVAMSFGSPATANFDVTPLGFRYYEYLNKRVGEPAAQVQSAITKYLDASHFKKKFQRAYQKWAAAEELLWETDSEQQLTTVGHLCREAVQEFADDLVNQYQPAGTTTDKTKTVARIIAVLNSPNLGLGSTEKPFVEALINYWRALNDLIQRQEHGAQKEGQKLVWEDARRVVFQTAITMFEIDRSISNAAKS